jgi:hypothetical protein
MLPEDDEDELEAPVYGEDEEDEGDEGPSGEGGQESGEDETEDAPGPDEDESESRRPERVEVQPEVPSRQRRSQSRWQARERELAELRQQKAEAEARANALAAQRQQDEAQRQRILQEQREQRRAVMTPEERTAEELQEIRAQINYQRDMDTFYRNDAADKAQFDAKTTVNKVYKRHQAAVEAELKKARANGWNIPREEILANIVGKEVMQVANRSTQPQPTRRKSVSKPVNSRSDATSTPGKRNSSSEHEARKKRLENIPL